MNEARADLDRLTQDIDNIGGKPYLASALRTSLVDLGHPQAVADDAVRERFVQAVP